MKQIDPVELEIKGEHYVTGQGPVINHVLSAYKAHAALGC
jgi:hypothetical protein